MASGIVRRIDELGRIVIPKELRRTMRLSEGDEMEICRDNENLILRKYNGFESVMPQARSVARLLADTLDVDVILVNTSKVVVAEGENKKHYMHATLSERFCGIVRSRKEEILHGEDINGLFLDRECLATFVVSKPIIVGGDLVGSIVMMMDNLPSDIARAYLDFCVQLISSALA